MLEHPPDQTSSGEQIAPVGDLKLCYETFGSEGDPPVLLVMGLAAQMILWDDEFCQGLAGRGFRVIRFDNRDIGRSTILREAPVPSRMQLILRDRRAAAYGLDDMAGDAAGLLDHLGIDAAHIVGVSMGGMIAQLIAILHPERTRSLVSIMSTTGNRRVGQPNPRMAVRLLRPSRFDRERYIEDHVGTYLAIGSPAYPPDLDHLRARAARCFDRGHHPAGAARQLAAVIAARDRTERLAAMHKPATVIHGDADPLVRISGGRATARAIPDAQLLVIPGMGHDLPRALWPQITDAIVATAERAPAA